MDVLPTTSGRAGGAGTAGLEELQRASEERDGHVWCGCKG